MQSDAATVQQYLAELPEDRRPTVEAVRQVVLDHLPGGFEEVMQYGMISYVVPLERYPDTYNGQALAMASLASQKRHLSLYLMGVYGDAGRRPGCGSGGPPTRSSTWARAACASSASTTSTSS